MKFNATYHVQSKEEYEYLEDRMALLSRHCSTAQFNDRPLGVLVRLLTVQNEKKVHISPTIPCPYFEMIYSSRAVDDSGKIQYDEEPLEIIVKASAETDFVNIVGPERKISDYIIEKKAPEARK